MKAGLFAHLLPGLVLAAAASGCSCKDEKHADAPGDAEPATVASAEQPAGSSGTPVAPVRTVTETVVSGGFPLTRVAPEQLSQNIVQATGFDDLINADNATGQRLDYLLMLFGVPLGGVDFGTTTRRDPSTKAQTLLVSRVVAWQLAQAAVWKDHERTADAQRLFVKCALKTDRPWLDSDRAASSAQQAAVRAGELRWWLQVDEVFFRLYSRPATDAEKDAVRTAFVAALRQQGYPPMAWVVVLYAMLGSQEFWHI